MVLEDYNERRLEEIQKEKSKEEPKGIKGLVGNIPNLNLIVIFVVYLLAVGYAIYPSKDIIKYLIFGIIGFIILSNMGGKGGQLIDDEEAIRFTIEEIVDRQSERWLPKGNYIIEVTNLEYYNVDAREKHVGFYIEKADGRRFHYLMILDARHPKFIKGCRPFGTTFNPGEKAFATKFEVMSPEVKAQRKVAKYLDTGGAGRPVK